MMACYISLQRGVSKFYLETNKNTNMKIKCKLCSWMLQKYKFKNHMQIMLMNVYKKYKFENMQIMLMNVNEFNVKKWKGTEILEAGKLNSLSEWTICSVFTKWSIHNTLSCRSHLKSVGEFAVNILIFTAIFIIYFNIYIFWVVKTTQLVRIHKSQQLLVWPFTRLLLEGLCIKKRNYFQVKAIDLWS